jgi:aminoglycoside/choline kinase family phosphotransferase
MERDKRYLYSKLKHVKQIVKIRGEASARAFYRVYFDNLSLVAMVYPGESSVEIEKIVRLTGVYQRNNIPVPAIREVIDNRVVLQEDLGDVLVQKAFSRMNRDEKRGLLETVSDVLVRLRAISTGHTQAFLDTARMKWEMDFFLTHFAENRLTLVRGDRGLQGIRNLLSPEPLPEESSPLARAQCKESETNGKPPPDRRKQENPLAGSSGEFRDRLYRMVEQIQPIDTFAHRDFHSRNLLLHKGLIYLVDFQDSLVASPWYDLVSIAFDCYLELKPQRELLIDLLQERGVNVDRDLFYITALQRNIKALGTFAYQVTVRKNLAYRKYIPRTLRHILTNPLFAQFFHSRFFLDS